MSEGEEEVAEAEDATTPTTPTTPRVEEMMEAAKETDYVARAQSGAPDLMGPAMQPKEDKKKEREAFELDKPKTNKWASGAFQRGVALQVCFSCWSWPVTQATTDCSVGQPRCLQDQSGHVTEAELGWNYCLPRQELPRKIARLVRAYPLAKSLPRC